MIEHLFVQQKALIEKIPGIAPFFISIDDQNGSSLPFLPIGTFRKFHVFQKDIVHKSFMSSGSTNDVRARHSFTEDGLLLYEKRSAANFRNFLSSLKITCDTPIISLVPMALEWPLSSLSAMIAMFKKSGLNVQYLGEDFIDIKDSMDIIIFGTSFHHLLLEQDLQRDKLIQITAGKRVTVIDTGGTKGRTRNYDVNEVYEIIQATYPSALSVNVVSEYGMCELASQAWSIQTPHNGWFLGNDSLIPLIIDLDKRQIVHTDDHAGFLAFIDHCNQDSFMAIITEDLALKNHKHPGCFKLLGRAPDASLKGCSLNVKASFQSTTKALSFTKIDFIEPMPISLVPEVVTSLPEAIWDRFSRKDLLLGLRSIEDLSTTLPKTRLGQRVLVILSANIPITFLYPAFMFRYRGAKELHLQLPSLRPNDPLSNRVRSQIITLAEQLAPFLDPMTLHLHSDKDISFSCLTDFDAVMVFGSDETIQTFEAALPKGNQTELIGLGSILNAHILNSDSQAEDVAETCGRWLGRGCLTPVSLVGENPHDGFIEELSRSLEKIFSERLEAVGFEHSTFHRHALLEIESLFKSLGLKPSDRIHRGKNTFLVDLRKTSIQPLSPADFPLSNAGSGLVFLVSEPQFQKFNYLKTYTIDPGFSDPHMGKTWTEWI